MDLVFDLLQGAGIAAAIGIRPFLPALLVAALASANAGVDFGGTDFSFLESSGFLVALLVGVVLADFGQRRLGPDRLETGAGGAALVAVAVALGGLYAAGSLADHGHSVIPGILAGVACAGVALVVSRALFARVRARLDPGAQAALPLYAEGVAILAAGVSVLFPPLALVIVGGLLWLLLAGRRREGQKYAGLRILR